jgi:periplasmic protein TonB
MTSSSHAQSRDSPKRTTTGNDGAGRGGSNIILLSRPGRAAVAPPIMLRAEDRPAPWWPQDHARGLMAVYVVWALALHAGLYALEREPAPVASIGELAIAVDILLGSQVTAGLSSTPSPSAAPLDAREAEQPAKADTTDPAPAEMPAQPQSAALEPQPPLSNAEPEPPARELVAPPPHPTTIERKPPAVERKPPQKAREQRTTSQREARLHPAVTGRATPASTASTASSGTGRGRSDADSNYPGRVYAHLARHQRAPSAGGGDHGVARLTISLDGSGGVTGVRLTQSSGNAGFDQEAQAIVRRASPLPPPPTGRPLTLGWSVSFR